MKKIQFGPVSSDTLKTEHLMPVFVNELLNIDPDNQFGNYLWAKYSELEEGDDDYWKSEEADFDLSELIDELNDVCDIPYVYFGSSEGDGACFGYFVNRESVMDDVRYGELVKVSDLDIVKSDFTGLVLLETKNYDCSLYHFENGVPKEMIW